MNISCYLLSLIWSHQVSTLQTHDWLKQALFVLDIHQSYHDPSINRLFPHLLDLLLHLQQNTKVAIQATKSQEVLPTKTNLQRQLCKSNKMCIKWYTEYTNCPWDHAKLEEVEKCKYWSEKLQRCRSNVMRSKTAQERPTCRACRTKKEREERDQHRTQDQTGYYRYDKYRSWRWET